MSNNEDPQERPAEIIQIINGLERYNPEAVGPLETYLQQQCEQRFCDGNANRVLLKLYVFPLCPGRRPVSVTVKLWCWCIVMIKFNHVSYYLTCANRIVKSKHISSI